MICSLSLTSALWTLLCTGQGLRPYCDLPAMSWAGWDFWAGAPAPPLPGSPLPRGGLHHLCLHRRLEPRERSLPQTGLFSSQVRTNSTSMTTFQSRGKRPLNTGKTPHQGRGDLRFPGYLCCQCLLSFLAPQLVFTCSFCSVWTWNHV